MDVRREQCPRWKSQESHTPHFWNAGGSTPSRCGGWGTGHSDERCANKLHHEPHKWSEYNVPGEEGPRYCPGQDAIAEAVGDGLVTVIGIDPRAPAPDPNAKPMPISWSGFKGDDDKWGKYRISDGREDPSQAVGIEDALIKAWQAEMDRSYDLHCKLGYIVIHLLKTYPDEIGRVREAIPDPFELRKLITFHKGCAPWDDEDAGW